MDKLTELGYGYWLRLGGAVILLSALFLVIPVEDVLMAFFSLEGPPIGAAIVAGFAVHLGIAIRLRQLLSTQSLRFTSAEVLEINLGSLFYSLTVPAGNFASIAMRLYRLRGQENNYAGAGLMLVIERLFSTALMCVIGVLAWTIERPADGWHIPAILTGMLFMTLAAPVVVYGNLLPGLPIHRLSSRKLRDLIERVAEALRRVRSLRRDVLARVVLLTLITQVLGIFAYSLVATALALDLSFAAMAWARAVALTVAIVPVSIGGIGLREGAFVALLAPLGVGAADAVVLSLAGFACTTIVPAIIGGALETRRLALRSSARS